MICADQAGHYYDARPASPLFGLLLIPAVIWAFIGLFLLLMVALLLPRYALAQQQLLIRSWARSVLLLLAIRVEVHGYSNTAAEGAMIISFNHINALDFLVLASIWEKGWSAVYKKEFHDIPILGKLMQFFELIPIDRKNRARALATIEHAANTVREQKKRVLIAPEGTRSGDGKLAPFKSGPFHLAVQTRVPLVPMVMRGNEQLMQGWLVRPGVIRVDFLEPIATDHWRQQTMSEHMAELRSYYLKYLPE